LHAAGRRSHVDAVATIARELGAAGDKARRIAVVEAVPHAGAATTAVELARMLARQAQVVLIDLAVESPDVAVAAADPTAPGVAELVAGTASFGEIISRDPSSRLHLITKGWEAVDAAAINNSQRVSVALEALGRTYDHVVIKAGTPGLLDRSLLRATQALVVGNDLGDAATAVARRRMLDAGSSEVRVLAGAGPATGGAAALVAA
jgi:Mrp family chromosome partitioning ATPase